jgi:hypothetical protein
VTTPPLGPAEVALLATMAAGTAACAVSVWRRLAPPLWVAVLVALALRAGVAAFAANLTPGDVLHHFRLTGEWVRHGRDPLGGAHPLPGHEWNFLPLMPAVHALEQLLGLPWKYAAKVVPTLADCGSVALVYLVADREQRARAWQYAVNPVSLAVVAVHGQVEPVALCLALGALACYRRDRWAWAGLLAGAAVAVKTWPVLVLLALLRPARRTWRLVAGAAVVPLLVLGAGVLFLDTRVAPTVRGLTSYRGYVDNWGWAGTAVVRWGPRLRGYASPLGPLGTVLTAVAVIVVLWLCRDATPAVRVAAVLGTAVAVTAGFGNQYLMWPVPFLFAAGVPRRTEYVAAAGGWLALAYLPHAFPDGHTRDAYLTGLSWLVVFCICAVIARVATRRPVPPLP